jgi:hypothetical protein
MTLFDWLSPEFDWLNNRAFSWLDKNVLLMKNHNIVGWKIQHFYSTNFTRKLTHNFYFQFQIDAIDAICIENNSKFIGHTTNLD